VCCIGEDSVGTKIIKNKNRVGKFFLIIFSQKISKIKLFQIKKNFFSLELCKCRATNIFAFLRTAYILLAKNTYQNYTYFKNTHTQIHIISEFNNSGLKYKN